MLFGTRRSLLGSSVIYADKVKGIASNNLIGYFPLWERTGSLADNFQGDSARDGAYSGVTLADSTFINGDPVGLWDGVNDFCNIYSASLAGVFGKLEGTMALWAKASAAGVWTDGIARAAAFVGESGGANFGLLRKTTTNNQLGWLYDAAATTEAVTLTASPTAWFHMAITWSKSGDAVKAYYNGAQTGATQTGLGTWVNNIASGFCSIGAIQGASVQYWSGWLAHCAIWNTPLSAAQVLALATV